MSLRLQSLNHYSDFDGTSESEASEISIVLPYLPRLRGKKLSKAAEGQVRLKRGSRALRRYENEAYLSSLVMITEADAEYEADDYWPDKTNDDTAFKCLFEDEDIRAVWDAFIALSERKQIELLGALDNRPVSGDDDDDLNYEDVDMGDEMAAVRPPRNYNNCASGRSRHGNRRRCRRKPAVRLEGIKEDPSEEAMDAFGVLLSTENPLPSMELDVSLSPSASVQPDATTPVQTSDPEDGLSVPAGSLSTKLLDFIRCSVQQRQQTGSPQKGGRKKRHFGLQDLCLIQRVEGELRRAFATAGTPVRAWTPSTSLLKPTSGGQQACWIRGRPLALNGFQRMLVHATATYLGLHSFSTWNASFVDRQLWVENRGEAVCPPEQPLVVAIRSAIEKAAATS